MTSWHGRFEILRGEPPIIADGAHNVDSVNKLAGTLAEVFPGRRWVIVFGCYKDKDAAGMLKALGPRSLRWILTQVDNARATPTEQLLLLAQANLLKAQALPQIQDAMDVIIASDDPVCITGSIALVGAARRVWAQRSRAMLPESDE
jgi:dihydrofolate synthase/folylpolyglutamate synthase